MLLREVSETVRCSTAHFCWLRDPPKAGMAS